MYLKKFEEKTYTVLNTGDIIKLCKFATLEVLLMGK